MGLLVNPDNLSDEDELYSVFGDVGMRYLGHDKAVYSLVLFTPLDLLGRVFEFKLNPQSIEMDEEAAVTVTATQGGGKFIENQGNIFKDIIISGTTGFLPLKNMKSIPGSALLAQSAARVVSGDNFAAQAAFAKVSGYNEFMRLRSLFREYWQIHRLGDALSRKATTLFWVNLKDNETWLVEPMSFRMSRASRSPMTYNYNIRLRTIAKGSSVYVPTDTSTALGVVRQIRKTLAGVRDRIDAANALLRGALGFFDQYRNLRSMVVSILDVGTDLSAQLTKIASGTADVLDLPRSLLYSATANITSVFEGIGNAADLIAAVPLDAFEGLTTSRQQMDFVLARKDLFTKKWSSAWESAIANFNTTFGVSGDASSSLKDGTSRGGLAEATPSSNENIYQFAQRVTGDAMRAQEIIVLNNLKWPYFAVSADERAPGTIAPGDPVLVPVDYAADPNLNSITNSISSKDRSYKDEVDTSGASTLTKSGLEHWRVNEWKGFTVEILTGPGAGQTRLISSNTALELTVSEPWTTIPASPVMFRIFFQRLNQTVRSGMEELLGIDLRIRENQLTKTWDFVCGSNGDLSTIRGQDNLNQALTVKFITTQGELILHPWFGLKPVFGQRGTPEALFRLRLFFEQTLLSDSRVESIENLVVQQERDMYMTEVKLSVKGGLRSKFSSPLV